MYNVVIKGGELSHHGILGQKWGKKNGPPYPLDYSKLSDEERDKAKKDAIKTGNIREANAHKNKDYFTYNEMQDLINRYDLNSKLKMKVKDIDDEIADKGWKKLDKVVSKVGSLTNAVTAGSKFYNAAAKVSNTFLDTDFKIINGVDNSNQNNQNNQQGSGKKKKKKNK